MSVGELDAAIDGIILKNTGKDPVAPLTREDIKRQIELENGWVRKSIRQ